MTDQSTFNPSDNARSGLELLKSGEAARLDLISRIGQARSSTVISYLTSYRAGGRSSILDKDMRILERHIAMARANGAENIDLFLSTYGGQASMPWNFHAMFRDYFPKGRLGVIAPFETYSAGTVISLGADEIIMGLSSSLGPSDTQTLRWDLGEDPVPVSVSDMSGFMSLLKEFDTRNRLSEQVMLDWLTRKSDPLTVGYIYRVWRENRRKILKALTSRRKPLSQKENERIADFFLYEIGNHGQAIRRREAVEAGLSFISLLEDTECEKDVPLLFNEYASLMKLFSPHAVSSQQAEKIREHGDENDIDVYGVYAAHTPVAIVESEAETNAAFRAYGMSRHWDMPPPMVPTSGESDNGQSGDSSYDSGTVITWSSRLHGQTRPAEDLSLMRPRRK